MKNKQEKKTCNDKGEWGNFIYNGNSLKDILFWNFMRKVLLDNEEESRAYFDQLWAEAMVIFNSCKDKSSLLKLPKEMEEQIIDYRKQFMQEDTMAGQVQGWLDGYAGTYVCSRQIWKEEFNHYDGEPRKYETNEICQIMDTQHIGWKRGGYHRFS